MSATDKRFKVVRDATGDWGILDTLALEFELDAFAGYGVSDRVTETWLETIRNDAVALNTRALRRDEFGWSQYEPVARPA